MTITYPLEVPAPRFASIEFEHVDIQSRTRSKFTGKSQLQIYPGEYWRARIGWAPEHQTAIAEEVTAFLASLRGAVGNFLLRDPLNKQPRGAALTVPSSPVVNGSGQKGPTIILRNAPVSLDGWLLAGTRIQIGPNHRCQLCIVLNQVNTTAGGLATVDVWPRIRAGMIDGDAVTLNNPAGLFELDERIRYQVTPPFRYERGIVAVESF